MAESARERLMTYLKDAHALEQTSLLMTQTAARVSPDSNMRSLFDHHHQETHEHERLIRERIEAHGETVSTVKDLGGRVAAIGKGALAALPKDKQLRIARDGYVQEQTEVACYELLRRVAQRAGDPETADVAARILQNEQETAAKIAANWDLAVERSLPAEGAEAPGAAPSEGQAPAPPEGQAPPPPEGQAPPPGEPQQPPPSEPQAPGAPPA